MKFEPQTVFKPIPFHMCVFWLSAIICLLIFTIWKFYLRTHIFLHTHSKVSPRHSAHEKSLKKSKVAKEPSGGDAAVSKKKC